MPALYWCGRKWRTSSDDFVFSGVIFSVVLIANGVITLTRFRDHGGIFMQDCPKASNGLLWSFFSLGVTDICAAVSFLVTAVLSCRGSPFHIRKRRYVPFLLYVNTSTVLVMLVLNCFVVKYALYDKESSLCESPTRHFLRLAIGISFLVFFCFVIMHALVFDPDGRYVWRDSEEYQSLWSQRCRLLCCCCLKTRGNQGPFDEIARTFAGLFRGYDVVPSDIAAGMLLVHCVQKNELRRRQMNVRYPSPVDDGVAERISLQARQFPHLTNQQRLKVKELRTYSRFFLAAYGWLLYEYMHCCTGLPRLCCFDPMMCCRHHPGIHNGRNFYCDLTAILRITFVEDEDIILTNWNNSLFQPVFFVAIDKSTNAVVLAIRGTMSFVDWVTDMVASPSLLDFPDTERDASRTSDDYYVHGGMMQSALFIVSELRESGVLGRLLDGDLQTRRLIILGHSLGAGVASILSIILWSTEPTLRSRLQCLAYSPPGGLLSPALVVYSKSFITGCFVGNDVIPRMATHTLEALRESILDALMETNVSKSLLFMNMFRLDRFPKISNLRSANSEAERRAFRETFYNSQCASLTQPKKLYPPGTLVHYSKAVVRTRCVCRSLSGTFKCCCKNYEEIFVPIFETPKSVQCVICSRSMFADHFPDRVFDIIEETEERLNQGELERFFTGTMEESGEEEKIDYLERRTVSRDNILQEI